MSTHFDYCILGAGLAGVSLAHELLQHEASVCLIDPRTTGGGASGTPLGLVNPATGRYATKTTDAEACLSAVKNNLERVQQSSATPFFKQSGVLRPALDAKIARKMKENVVESDWPEGWIEWMDEEELKAFHPGINCVDGGVWLPVGMTVDVGSYLNAFTDTMKKDGLVLHTETQYQLNSEHGYQSLKLESGSQITFDQLVFTAGIYTSTIDLWEAIKFHPVKGQLAVLRTPSPFPFDHAVSALGYISSLSEREFLIGSTYEHSFDDESPDEQGLDYLLKRFGKVLPELREQSKVIDQWAGVRASTPNRKPVIGTHPEYDHLHLFAGLGSKGLLYSAYGAQLLTSHLMEGKEIPKELSIERFYP